MKILVKQEKFVLGQENDRFFVSDNRRFVRYHYELEQAEEDLERCLKLANKYDRT